MKTVTRIPAALLLALCSGAAFAGPGHDHSDILLRIHEGSIQTGELQADGQLVFPVRVFGADLDEFGFASDPGFDNAIGTFNPQFGVGFDILTSLRRWNGTDFSETATPVMRCALSGLEAFTPVTDVLVPGFSLSPAEDGSWHRHLGFSLTPADGPGVFLLSLRLRTEDPNVLPSDPFWLVFAFGADETTHDAAIDWANANLAGDVPCGADFNADGTLDPDDLADYIACYFSQPPCDAADVNSSGNADPDDLADYIAAYFAGC